MVVRLAYERGYLNTKNPNKIQRWGLVYWIYMDRRQRMEDVRAIQELQTFELNFDRWKWLHGYTDKEMVDGEEYGGVFDPREVDDFLEKYGNTLETPREMSYSEVAAAGGEGIYGMEV